MANLLAEKEQKCSLNTLTPREIIAQMAKDYKDGMSIEWLAEKYHCSRYAVRKRLQGFKADWFDYEKIAYKRVKRGSARKQPSAPVCIDFTLLEKTFASLGCTKDEIEVVKMAILNRNNYYKVEINPAMAKRIIKKTKSKTVEQLFEPYIKGFKYNMETVLDSNTSEIFFKSVGNL